MILCYDENTKKAIEKTGMMVIEFKRLVYKITNALETMKKIAKAATKAFDYIFQKAKEVLEHFAEPFWESLEEYAGIQRRRWRLVRVLDKLCSGMNANPAGCTQFAYHCRSNC